MWVERATTHDFRQLTTITGGKTLALVICGHHDQTTTARQAALSKTNRFRIGGKSRYSARA